MQINEFSANLGESVTVPVQRDFRPLQYVHPKAICFAALSELASRI
ncbi:MAG: hypothetical protein IPP17_21485 [Bacteroidetes bacterium]|nr:hypothetical protein [Bacteroidota bacterium]